MATPDSPEQPKPTRKDLAEKRKLFVEFYLGEAHGNGTEAARLAGYEFPSEEAYRLLRNAQVRARIDERLAEVAMTANEVLAELSDIARAEWREFLIIKRNKDGDEVEVKMDLSSKVKSLELIGKAHGQFTEKVHHSGEIATPITTIRVTLDPDLVEGES
jgi:phage terminase small subunit